jgi:hypothetical protein
VLLIFIALLAPLAALFASVILIFVIFRRKIQDHNYRRHQ